jgi:hypothetical protein
MDESKLNPNESCQTFPCTCETHKLIILFYHGTDVKLILTFYDNY